MEDAHGYQCFPAAAGLRHAACGLLQSERQTALQVRAQAQAQDARAAQSAPVAQPAHAHAGDELSGPPPPPHAVKAAWRSKFS